MNLTSAFDPTAVWSSFQRLAVAKDIASVSAIVKEFAGSRGFNNSGFALKPIGNHISANFVSFLDFPAEWAKRYQGLSSKRRNSADPVIQHVTRSQIPTAWDRRGKVTFTAPTIAGSARGLLGSAGEHGLHAGLTMPLLAQGVAWSYLVLTTRATSNANDLLAELPCSHLLAQGVIVAMLRIVGGPDDNRPTLTPGEREVLHWSAVGKTSWETSVILGISEHTVNFRLQSVCRKLGVRGRTAAVSRALVLGLIAP